MNNPELFWFILLNCWFRKRSKSNRRFFSLLVIWPVSSVFWVTTWDGKEMQKKVRVPACKLTTKTTTTGQQRSSPTTTTNNNSQVEQQVTKIPRNNNQLQQAAKPSHRNNAGEQYSSAANGRYTWKHDSQFAFAPRFQLHSRAQPLKSVYKFTSGAAWVLFKSDPEAWNHALC